MYEWINAEARALMTRPPIYTKWSYENGILCRALWMAAEKTGKEELFRFVIGYTNQYVMPDGSIPTYPADTYNMDMLCWGALLPKLHAYTGDGRYRAAEELLLRQLEGQPRTREGGFWHKQIYPGQMWLDGIYMGCPFMTRAAAFLKKEELYEEVARQMTLCFERTFDPAVGLCRHAWDSERKQLWADPVTGQSPHVWGRAMGWFCAAHADVLAELPRSHPAWPTLAEQLRTLVRGLLKWQREGLWYQVTDRPEQEGNYTESSCSAMFAYAMAKGARIGVLDKAAEDAAERALQALIEKKVTVGADGLPCLNDICRVAGLGGNPYRDGSYGYYIHETVCADDYKGTAPFLMALVEKGL